MSAWGLGWIQGHRLCRGFGECDRQASHDDDGAPDDFGKSDRNLEVKNVDHEPEENGAVLDERVDRRLFVLHREHQEDWG